MKLRRSFTIIELLISISLSSFIMLGMMQLYRNVARYLENTREMMNSNRKVCLLFNQLERDFSTAFVFDAQEEEKKGKEAIAIGGAEENPEEKGEQEASSDKGSEKSKEEAKKAAEKKAKLRRSYFFALRDERADPFKIDGKRYELFKDATIICTNPLQVFGQKMVRLMRVKYELTVDKEKSKGELLTYKLWRKETADLANEKMVIDEHIPKEKVKPVRTYLIADHIKSFFIEYVSVKKNTKAKKEAGEPEQTEIRSFSWGDKKELEGIVPQRIEVRVEFWNDALSASYPFHTIFPILSYATMKEEKEKKKEKAQKTSPLAETPPTDGSQPPEGVPGGAGSLSGDSGQGAGAGLGGGDVPGAAGAALGGGA